RPPQSSAAAPAAQGTAACRPDVSGAPRSSAGAPPDRSSDARPLRGRSHPGPEVSRETHPDSGGGPGQVEEFGLLTRPDATGWYDGESIGRRDTAQHRGTVVAQRNGVV